MRSFYPTSWLVPLALLLSSAAPRSPVEQAIRQGNAAFVREDYEASLTYYTRAEESATDPGLVAFNKAAALYRLGRYREAELHYRRSLEGAEGARRARGLYDLGNCLLQQSQGKDIRLLEQAARCYEQCRSVEGINPTLQANAEHNLELARLLWLRARADARNTPPEQANGGQSQQQPKDKPMTEPGDPTGEPDDPQERNAEQGKSERLPNGQQKAAETRRPAPGRGNLPTLPDTEKLVPLAPEDTAAYLERVAQRVLRERREHWRSAAPPVRTVKDW